MERFQNLPLPLPPTPVTSTGTVRTVHSLSNSPQNLPTTSGKCDGDMQ